MSRNLLTRYPWTVAYLALAVVVLTALLTSAYY
jgi:hypothetical protein